MVNQEVKKIALVLSGGLSRGAAELSFASEIVKKIGYDRICVISGSSIGAMNSYALSVKNQQNLIDFYLGTDCDNTRHFMKKIKNDLFNKVFRQIEGDTLHVPTYVTGTRILGLECYYFCLNSMPREDIKTAVNVSMSFPIINGPLKFLQRYWIDGGATDNVPVLPTTYYDPDMVIILHCYPKYYPPEDLYAKLKPGAVVIDVDVTLSLPKSINSFALSKTNFETMVEVGTKEGKEFADFIFQDYNLTNIRERGYQFINSKLCDRHEKGGDGLMGLVDVLNALYVLKNNIV